MQRRDVAVADERRARLSDAVGVEQRQQLRRCRSRRARPSRRRRPISSSARCERRARDARRHRPTSRRRSNTRSSKTGSKPEPLQLGDAGVELGAVEGAGRRHERRRGCPGRTGRNLMSPAAVARHHSHAAISRATARCSLASDDVERPAARPVAAPQTAPSPPLPRQRVVDARLRDLGPTRRRE